MSLTTGRGPLSPDPAGRFSSPVAEHLVYVEPFRRRVKGVQAGEVVVDSDRVLLVHRPGEPPAYAFPAADVTSAAAAPDPHAPDHVRVPWDAVESWYEEDEEAFGHPLNPYHRVDCLRTTRRLRVMVGDTVMVDCDETVGVYETALEPRLYVARDHVRMDLLVASATTTYCPYKGEASYWNAVVGGRLVEDVAWSYDDPLPESLRLGRLLAFDQNRVAVTQDLPPASTAMTTGSTTR